MFVWAQEAEDEFERGGGGGPVEASDSPSPAADETGISVKPVTNAPEKGINIAVPWMPLNISVWGETRWAPVVYKGDADGKIDDAIGAYQAGDLDGAGAGMGSGPGYDSIGGALGFAISGANKARTGGFELNIGVKSASGDGPVLYAKDNTAYLWLSPVNFLRAQFGMYRYDGFRGQAGGINEEIGGWGGDEDTIFQRAESDEFGALFLFSGAEKWPKFVKPLRAFLSLGVTGELDEDSDVFAALTEKGLAYILASPHAGLGYDIENLFFIRAQYIGSKYTFGHGTDTFNGSQRGSFWFPSHVNEAARVEAAVNIKAVKNLNLDIGVSVPSSVTVQKNDYGTVMTLGPTFGDLGPTLTGSRVDVKIAEAEGDVWQPPLKAALGADFTAGKFSLRCRASVETGESVQFYAGGPDYKAGLCLEGGFEPAYNIGFCKLLADFSLRYKANDTLDNTQRGTNATASALANENQLVTHNGKIDVGLGAWFWKDFTGGVTLKAGVTTNIPVGGDGYYWTANGTDDQIAVRKAYRLSQFLVEVPVILTVSL